LVIEMSRNKELECKITEYTQKILALFNEEEIRDGRQGLLQPEELKNRLECIRESQRDLANTSEGNFKQEDMDTIFFDGMFNLLNSKVLDRTEEIRRQERERIIKEIEECGAFDIRQGVDVMKLYNYILALLKEKGK